MRANTAETVYPTQWPAFPGETEGRHLALADIDALDEAFSAPHDPDWLAISAVFQQEEAKAFKEADESPIYDYEIEMQRPVPSLEEPAAEKPRWRERVKRIMGRAGEAVREASVSAAATVQAAAEKTHSYYSDNREGNRRQKVAGAVAGAVILGGLTYLEYKGISGASTAQEANRATHQSVGQTLLSLPIFSGLKPHHHEHVRHVVETALRSGGNPWTITKAQLYAHGVEHPSKVRIAADDARLLKLNHISPLQALKLHVGEKLKLLKNW